MMKTTKKALVTLLAGIGIAASAPASAIIVGGIDFGVLGASPFNTHIETATLAQTFVNGNGQNATAYGFISTVNGDTTYCADGSANCGLYYVANFNNSQNFNGAYVEFTAATISVFYSASPALNLLNQDSNANLLAIQAMTPWVTLTGHDHLGGVASPNAVVNGVGTLTGGTLSGSGFGLLDVDLAGPGNLSVANYLNGNNTPDAIGNMADITITSSFNNNVLNPFDVANGLANGCKTGQAQAGAWCFQGTNNLRGDTVIPEPGMLGLMGIGLLGFGAAASRRRKTGKTA